MDGQTVKASETAKLSDLCSPDAANAPPLCAPAGVSGSRESGEPSPPAHLALAPRLAARPPKPETGGQTGHVAVAHSPAPGSGIAPGCLPCGRELWRRGGEGWPSSQTFLAWGLVSSHRPTTPHFCRCPPPRSHRDLWLQALRVKFYQNQCPGLKVSSDAETREEHRLMIYRNPLVG